MILATCQHDQAHKHGKDRHGNPRFKCVLCSKTFVKEIAKPIGEMRIPKDKAVMAIKLFLEGVSVRSVQRLTGICRDTLADLIATVGYNCRRLLDAKIRNVAAKDVQVDELWSFVGMKEKTRLKRNQSIEFGDSWTFIGIERDTKLILAYQIGQRDATTCKLFLDQLKVAIGGRFQLTTDGFNSYTSNVPFTFGTQVDYAQLIKNYASSQTETRYSPATIISAEKHVVFGNPINSRISTSHIERANLTLRMTLRRFTRLTNAHSKSLKHHAAMQSIFFAFYNFARKHETLKGKTPAMASGLTDSVWSVERLLDEAAAV